MKGVEPMPKTTKEFDKSKYDKEYQRNHYRKLTAAFTKDEAATVEATAKELGLTKSAFIKAAVQEKIERKGK